MRAAGRRRASPPASWPLQPAGLDRGRGRQRVHGLGLVQGRRPPGTAASKSSIGWETRRGKSRRRARSRPRAAGPAPRAADSKPVTRRRAVVPERAGAHQRQGLGDVVAAGAHVAVPQATGHRPRLVAMGLQVAVEHQRADFQPSAQAAGVGTARQSREKKLRPVGSTSGRPRVGAPLGPGATRRPSRPARRPSVSAGPQTATAGRGRAGPIQHGVRGSRGRGRGRLRAGRGRELRGARPCRRRAPGAVGEPPNAAGRGPVQGAPRSRRGGPSRRGRDRRPAPVSARRRHGASPRGRRAAPPAGR